MSALANQNVAGLDPILIQLCGREEHCLDAFELEAKPMHVRIAEVRVRFSSVLFFIKHFAETRVRNIRDRDPAPRFWRFKPSFI